MQQIGKRVVDDIYLHISALPLLPSAQDRIGLHEALAAAPSEAAAQANVIKFNSKSGRVALLHYPEFEQAPFPVLRASWSRSKGNGGDWSFRSYESSLNPPILHRKELLVTPDHPGRAGWARLTQTAEELGLFDETTTIGFFMNWERAIAEKGFQLVGEEFVPLANDLPRDSVSGIDNFGDPVQRHLTALSRTSLSAPIQFLLRFGLLDKGESLFDYGCGRGDDIAELAEQGFTVTGWDPHYAPDREIHPADIVNLGFVVNVIEDPAERVEAIQKAFSLANKVLSVGVMLYAGDNPGRQYRDGFLTSRNTFQKYFSQSEFKDYLEQVLHQEAFLVAPGIAFVFADKALEQRFLADRYRARGVAARLLAARQRISIPRAERPPRVSASPQLLESARPVLDELWRTALDLGRYPDDSEVPESCPLESAIGSLSKATRLLAQHYDKEGLAAAAQSRKDDLRLYFAMQQFSRRPRYRQLEPRLQRDIKAFFGDYAAAQAAGLQLLAEAGNRDAVLSACREAAAQGLGSLDGEHSLQLHSTLVERLPVVLRAYVSCGLVLYGGHGDAQLVKIHIASGKLTLLELEDFASSPLPRLRKRIKINVRRLDYDIFEYGSAAFPMPLLYRKSRYLHEEMPGYSEQLAFDEALAATQIFDDREYGPPAEDLLRQLELRRLSIRGLRLEPSDTVPDLDAPCGANFRYRDFIECGETQKRLGITNIPRRPETYNALYALAVNILDPVIDYFGPIRLTYGFCSAELGKHIKARVAPELDQHASYELRRNGKPICERGGAACDFIVDDEDMREVADWILGNTKIDRLYYYAPDRPVHVSYEPTERRAAFQMVPNARGALTPRPYT